MSGKASFGFRDVDAADKAGMVRGVFDRVAGRYDLMNDLMSAGVHRLWKDMTAARLNPQPGETIIDCAGGTGDMARRFARLEQRVLRRNVNLFAVNNDFGHFPEFVHESMQNVLVLAAPVFPPCRRP